jgi:hypothetical protein
MEAARLEKEKRLREKQPGAEAAGLLVGSELGAVKELARLVVALKRQATINSGQVVVNKSNPEDNNNEGSSLFQTSLLSHGSAGIGGGGGGIGIGGGIDSNPAAKGAVLMLPRNGGPSSPGPMAFSQLPATREPATLDSVRVCYPLE